ncbi:sensor histidine kinase [Jannaschia sp. CCS1]|uniref:sensor histidine kinase n=1 Tax=Jannaschia sp. (strain CCS1) TaxID=290400 RepID=UPI000053D086|nr:sensor histidine kinase [Jannaschia sp. CCS1]ABD56481.1 signal transduction histidine kinase [Jannaschia sp. CCS1]
MTSIARRWVQIWSRVSSLKARLALFLGLAILPLGIIAVAQTAAVVRDARTLEQNDILARTAQAASTERALLRRAHGAATALGVSAVAAGAESALCADIMRRFVDRAQAYVFAGFTTADGNLECTSNGEVLDLSGRADWQDFVERPQPTVTVDLSEESGGQSVIIATAPIFDSETEVLLGAAAVALPHSLTDTLLAAQVEEVELALINDRGQVLSASTGITEVGIFEDLSVPADDLGTNQRGVTFNVIDENGEPRLAALVPLIEDRVYVLGLWSGSVQNHAVAILGTVTPLFPVLMWVVAFGVGYLALENLVLRHLREIRRRMTAFSFDDPSAGFANLEDPPAEFRQIAATYNRMIDRMLADRAELAESLEEKELLLREVHHRVKNNLQLIASILNMQMRSVPDGDARRVLRRVQDRVMSLSTIHKALYTGTTMVHVRADKLLGEVVQAAFNMGVPQGRGIETSMHLDPLDLDPDQAVPLALLANETVINAVKYIGRPEDGTPKLQVRLYAGDEREVTLIVENSLGGQVQEDMAGEGTGLGTRLVEAFVAQLGGTQDVVTTEGLYRFQMTFTAFALPGEDTYSDTDDTAPLAQTG